MKQKEIARLKKDITQEEIDFAKSMTVDPSKKDITKFFAIDNNTMLVFKQINAMVIIFRKDFVLNEDEIKFITSSIKAYLFKNTNIDKVHIVIPKVSYSSILSFLIASVPLINKYIWKKIIVHHYNFYKDIDDRAPSILNALPLYIRENIMIDGSREFTIGHLVIGYESNNDEDFLTVKCV